MPGAGCLVTCPAALRELIKEEAATRGQNGSSHTPVEPVPWPLTGEDDQAATQKTAETVSQEGKGQLASVRELGQRGPRRGGTPTSGQRAFMPVRWRGAPGGRLQVTRGAGRLWAASLPRPLLLFGVCWSLGKLDLWPFPKHGQV